MIFVYLNLIILVVNFQIDTLSFIYFKTREIINVLIIHINILNIKTLILIIKLPSVFPKSLQRKFNACWWEEFFSLKNILNHHNKSYEIKNELDRLYID